jgi:hypothetical protein
MRQPEKDRVRASGRVYKALLIRLAPMTVLSPLQNRPKSAGVNVDHHMNASMPPR